MIQISDTTLRDGAQAEGISFSLDDKLQMIRELDDLGVQWIEAGNPAANPLDAALFDAVCKLPPLRHASLCAFGSTCRPLTSPEEDEMLLKLDRKSLLSSSENPGSRMKRNRVTPALEASQIPPVR